ncbi:J domain-containing protein [Paenibacillus bouchesdurhonensis]|uniref:J domain-containing protein n=1 Tax=Paenibacillus bouchesdurhonensis TaxID=1870990 RepID=UPI000DA62AB8|nr:tetratricopeptide repeat protein [Paenibacillus bouchesdurhonensis]
MAEPYMTIWQWLGIEPTNDIKQIKRAYKKQLQVYHPEDDPAGYQELREAYDRALKIAKQRNEMEQSFNELNYIEQDQQDRQEGQIEQAESQHTDEPERTVFIPPRLPIALDMASLDHDFDEWAEGSQKIDEFIERAIALYDHYPSRISSEDWVGLLNSKVTWNIYNIEEISERLLVVLEGRPFLPKEIWKLLEGFFGWRFDLGERWNGYEHEGAHSFAQYYVKQLDEPGLRYEFLLNACDKNVEQFLRLRYKGYQALMANNLYEAGSFLEQAYAIFADDPDLLRLMGEYYARVGNDAQALEAYDKLIQVVPEEMDGYFQLARMKFQQGEYAEAAEELQALLTCVPRLVEARLLLCHCWLKLGQGDRAKDGFLEVIGEAEPGSLEAIQALNGLAIVHPEYVKVLHSQGRQAERRQLVRNRRLFWRLLCVFTALLMSIGWFVYSVVDGTATRSRGTINITNLNELYNAKKGSYVTLSLTDVKDLNLGQYELEADTRNPKVVIQERTFAEKNLRDYGFAKSYVYVGSFKQQNVIFLSKKWLGDAAKEKEYSVAISGYFHKLASTDVESAAFQALQWLPSEREKPESYYSKYIEEGPQYKRSFITEMNVFAFAFVLFFLIWFIRLQKEQKRTLQDAFKERNNP